MKYIEQENQFSFAEPLLNALLSMKSSDKIARTLTSKTFPLDASVVFDGQYSANKEGKILFSKDEDGTWQQMKPGKFLRRVFPSISKHCSDQDIERFVNFLKSKMSNGDIEVWDGEDVLRSYRKDEHLNESSTLGCSCMNNKPYVEAYTTADDEDLHPKVACVMKEGKIAGKALIWSHAEVEIDRSWVKRKVMDRIYSVEDKYIQTVAEWGFANGYIVRDERSYDERQTFYHTLEQFNNRDSVELQVRISSELFQEADSYPYTDTFHYDDDEYIYNTDYKCSWVKKYNCTGGGHEDDEDTVTLANGDRCHSDDATWVEGRDEHYHNDDVVWTGDYAIHQDDAVEDVNGDWIHEDDSAETHSGLTVHQNDIQYTGCSSEYAFCDSDVDDNHVVRATAGDLEDEWILNEDSIVLGDGNTVHEDEDIVEATLGVYENKMILKDESVDLYDDNIAHQDDSIVMATAGMYEGLSILEDESVEILEDIIHENDATVTITWGDNEGSDILESIALTVDGFIIHEDDEDEYKVDKINLEKEID